MRIANALLFLALLAAILVGAAGLGRRFGLWQTEQAFDMLRIGAWASAGAVVLSVAGVLWLISRRRFVAVLPAMAALIVAGIALYAPWQMAQTAQHKPALHDISTDTQEPPQFVALKAARDASPNGAGWSGEEAAQRQHYPDIAPVILALPPERAMERVRNVAQELGWTVVESSAADGRLEATTRSLWFGFTDDIVVRLRPENSGTRLDIRSASREGASDLGKNAERIALFVERLRTSAP